MKLQKSYDWTNAERAIAKKRKVFNKWDMLASFERLFYGKGICYQFKQFACALKFVQYIIITANKYCSKSQREKDSRKDCSIKTATITKLFIEN